MCSWVSLSILKYKYNLLYERLFIINIIYYKNGYYNKYNLLYEQLFLDGMGFKIFSLRL